MRNDLPVTGLVIISSILFLLYTVGAILVSLNSPVDPDHPHLMPWIDPENKMPYLYIDNAKSSADPVTLFRAAISVMKYIIKQCENEAFDTNSEKLQGYILKCTDLLKNYNKLKKSHYAMEGTLNDMKTSIENLLKDLQKDDNKNQAQGEKRVTMSEGAPGLKKFKSM